MKEFLLHAFEGWIRPTGAFLIGVINYILFPDEGLMIAAMAVVIASVLDLLTKARAIAKNNGGIKNARKTGKFNSNKLWEGTKSKFFDYLVIFILCGLAYRISTYRIFQGVSIILATGVYALIFTREFISCLENLDEAGGNFKGLIKWTKRKQKQILQDDSSPINNDSNANSEV